MNPFRQILLLLTFLLVSCGDRVLRDPSGRSPKISIEAFQVHDATEPKSSQIDLMKSLVIARSDQLPTKMDTWKQLEDTGVQSWLSHLNLPMPNKETFLINQEVLWSDDSILNIFAQMTPVSESGSFELHLGHQELEGGQRQEQTFSVGLNSTEHAAFPNGLVFVWRTKE